MAGSVDRVRELGQSIWYDNISRGMIKSGELKRLVDMGVSGLTSNPTIFEKAIAQGKDYDEVILDFLSSGKGVDEAYEALVVQDIRDAADLLRHVYDRTDGADGYASLEVNPHLAHDTDKTVSEAERLFSELDRPNVMMKVPATPEGMPAIRRLIGEGININVTLIFSLNAYRDVRQAYMAGLEDLSMVGGDLSSVSSVASFFVSRLDTAVDGHLRSLCREDLKHVEGKAAVANAKMAYRDFSEDFGDVRFGALRQKGARVQRPLWASTSTKNPDYSDLFYVESLMGRDTVDTMPEGTLLAFLDHGIVKETLVEGVSEAQASVDYLADLGISMDQVTAQLLKDGVKSFSDSFDELITNLDSKLHRLDG